VNGPLDVVLFLLSFALVAAMYFAPTLVARYRKKSNATSIAVVNFFFGWTLLGWVICLAWALMQDNPPARA
jgi:Superinfection immunity protein